MKVTLLYHTPGAVDLLIFTKQTRLNMSPEGLKAIKEATWEAKLKELEYMSRTIPSSWEMIDVIFMIEGVSRAFANQLVRTRQASYAQQSMRVTDVSGFNYSTGPTIANNKDASVVYEVMMNAIQHAYTNLLKLGVSIEDARGILPLNIHTNIVAKYNFRAFCDLVRKRSSGRVQSEYRQALDLMVGEVMEVWPWSKLFFKSKKAEALARLTEHFSKEMETEKANGVKINETKAWERNKDLDLLREDT